MQQKEKTHTPAWYYGYVTNHNQTGVCTLIVPLLSGIHHQRIYDRVRRERPDLKDRLPRKGRKKRKKTGKRTVWVSTTRSIHNRPETDGLSREGDTLVGPTKTRILTHVERKSLYLDARVIRDGLSYTVHETLQKRPLQGQITYDCGSEFTLWKWIEEDTGATVYFCDPHSPGQRGKNENTTGRLRRVYPKNTDLSTIAQQNLNNIVHLMNNTPRKSLNWKTPAQVYTALVASQSRV